VKVSATILRDERLDGLVAEALGWVWQPVPWMNAEQSVLVPYAGFLKPNDPRVRPGDSVYAFVPRYSPIEQLMALLLVEMRRRK